MTNFEVFKEEIKYITQKGYRFGMREGDIFSCERIPCSECDFSHKKNGGLMCEVNKTRWLYSEYVEAPQWEFVPIDSLVTISDDGKAWHYAYFAGVSSGFPEVWADGRTSKTCGLKESWKYTHLVR